MRPPLLRWLSFRVRAGCVLIFIISALLPPYAPRTAQAFGDVSLGSQQFLFAEEGFLLKSSSLGAQGTRLAYGEGIIYHVQEGDTLQTIAKQFNLSADTIRWANDLDEATPIQPKQELVILPVDGVLHTVQKGQTVGGIAKLYGVSADLVTQQNRIQNNLIVAGQQIIIPGGKPLVAGGGTAVAVNGSPLHFGDRLSDAQLKFQLPDEPSQQRAIAPSVGVGLTQTVLQMPCQDCSITQYFNASHYALDIQTPGGGPIFAAADGTVIRADHGWNGGYGNVIEIDHGNGMVTLYGHNKELYVKVGDRVKRGEKISWMGNTGLVHGPTGIHVHFEVRVNGVKKNPLLYLE